MSEPVLVADRLTKAYGKRAALRGVSLHVEPGEVVGLLGPNGAGKTTTVKCLTGLVRPTSGTATLFGRPAGDPEARRKLGYLPELFRFPDWMTGHQVVRLHAELAGVPKSQRNQRAEECLDRVGLAGRGGDKVRGYSKGMSQRLGMAQALVGRPELLLLDEPTSALDPVGRRDIRDLVAELKAEGVAVLLNSHLLSEVEKLCDRVAIVDRGQVKFEGKLHELTGGDAPHLELKVARPDDQLLQALLDFGRPDAHQPSHQTGAETGVIRMRLDPPWDTDPEPAIEKLAAIVATGPWGLLGLHLITETLEDAFVALVEGGDR